MDQVPRAPHCTKQHRPPWKLPPTAAAPMALTCTNVQRGQLRAEPAARPFTSNVNERTAVRYGSLVGLSGEEMLVTSQRQMLEAAWGGPRLVIGQGSRQPASRQNTEMKEK